MMFKILLINPEKSHIPPIGLLYIASVLERRGNYVKIVEFPPLSCQEKNLDLLFSKWITNEGYDLVGITCMGFHYRFVEKLVTFFRTNFERMYIVTGGIYPSIFPEGFLKAGADTVVIGEGEETICDLVDVLENQENFRTVSGLAYISDNNLVYTEKRDPPKDLDNLPYPAYHLVDMRHYFQTSKLYGVRGLWVRAGWIMTSRGCIGKCNFCNYKMVHGFGIRKRSITNVVDELEYLKKKHKIKVFWVIDDTFTISEKRVVEFCDELRKRKLKLKWTSQTRTDMFTENMARAMKSSRCVQAEFGVESGSQKVLDLMNKGITIEQTIKAFEICKKYNLRTFANIILGYPGETFEDIKKTKELLKKIKPTMMGFYFICPYPGTKLYEQSIENKWIVPSDVERFGHTDDPILCVNVDKEKLLEIREDFLKSLYVKRSFINYLFQPAFIIDMTKMCLRKPGFVFKVINLFFQGKRNDVINLIKDEVQKL